MDALALPENIDHSDEDEELPEFEVQVEVKKRTRKPKAKAATNSKASKATGSQDMRSHTKETKKKPKLSAKEKDAAVADYVSKATTWWGELLGVRVELEDQCKQWAPWSSQAIPL